MAIVGLITLSLLLPPHFPGRLGIKIGNWMMHQGEKYFGLKTIIEDEENLIEHAEEKNKAIIFAVSPHDILPYGAFAFNPTLNRLPGKINDDGKCLMTSAVFNVPILKHVYTWTGGLSVDKKTFVRRLNSGESFSFIPGGVQEVLLLDPTKPDDIVLYLQNRKGFIKLALSTGSPVCPCFIFNLDGSYGYWAPKGKIVEKISRQIGFLPLIYYGRWKIPFGIPYPQKIHLVVGKCLDIPKIEGTISQNDIDKYHALFLDELEALFERHKHGECGYSNRKLVFK